VIFQTFFYSKLCKQKELGRLTKKIKPEIMAAIHAPSPFRSSHLSELSSQDDLAHPAADSSVDVIFSIRMNVKLFHIAADGCGTLATQGKMLHIFTFLHFCI